MDVTPTGARLWGVTAALDPGFVIGLQCGRRKARFIVAWIGQTGSAREGQIGLRSSADNNFVWGVALPRVMGDYFVDDP